MNITRNGLARIKLFNEVSPESVEELSKNCRWREYKAEEVVLDRSSDSRDVYYITDGSVRVMNFIGEDREVTLAVMKAGGHFGELAAIGSPERTARVIALENTMIAAMSREYFMDMLLRFPAISLRLLTDLAYVISSMNERVATLSLTAPRQRVYLELLRLAVPDPRGGGDWVIEPLPKHDEIAAWAGVEVWEVAHAIGKLSREKVLERQNRTLVIHDRAKIHEMSGM